MTTNNCIEGKVPSLTCYLQRHHFQGESLVVS
jgi:hypothetical protein